MLEVLFVLVLIVGALYLVASTLAGMQPVSAVTAETGTDVTLAARRFSSDPRMTEQAYRRAVEQLPGAEAVSNPQYDLLVDSKPSWRIIGGAYGVVIRFRFVGTPDGATIVETSGSQKVPWAWVSRAELSAAIIEVERKVRMQAKSLGAHQIA